MEGAIIYGRISDGALAQRYGGNLDPIWVPNIFFYLTLQEFCDFSGT